MRPPKFNHVLDSPVVRIFDVVKSLAKPDSDDLLVLPQPSVRATKDDDELKLLDNVFVGSRGHGGLYALSELNFPYVTRQASSAGVYAKAVAPWKSLPAPEREKSLVGIHKVRYAGPDPTRASLPAPAAYEDDNDDRGGHRKGASNQSPPASNPPPLSGPRILEKPASGPRYFSFVSVSAGTVLLAILLAGSKLRNSDFGFPSSRPGIPSKAQTSKPAAPLPVTEIQPATTAAAAAAPANNTAAIGEKHRSGEHKDKDGDGIIEERLVEEHREVANFAVPAGDGAPKPRDAGKAGKAPERAAAGEEDVDEAVVGHAAARAAGAPAVRFQEPEPPSEPPRANEQNGEPAPPSTPKKKKYQRGRRGGKKKSNGDNNGGNAAANGNNNSAAESAVVLGQGATTTTTTTSSSSSSSSPSSTASPSTATTATTTTTTPSTVKIITEDGTELETKPPLTLGKLVVHEDLLIGR